MRRMFAVGLVAMALQAGLAFADEAGQVKEIQSLVKEHKLDAAEAKFRDALKQYPTAAAVNDLRFALYTAHLEAGNAGLATEHLLAFFDYTSEQARKTSALARSMPPQVNMESALAELRTSKIALLTRLGKTKEARDLLTAELAVAEGEFAKHDADINRAMRVANLYKTRMQSMPEGDTESANREKYLAFLNSLVKKHPTNSLAIGAYLDGTMQTGITLMRSNPVEAEKVVTALQDYLKTIKTEDAALKTRITSANTTIASIMRSIESEKLRFALIGKPALPLDVEAWMNGSPLTDSDLRGKVVLLDFWAVWCGPCIATFPHLRDWQDKYADKGLVIIGMTRYYQYDWDDEAKKIKRDPELSPEKERAAVISFAEHHKLKHRLAEMPKDSEFSKNYGVTGIPQAVLIDQEGKVRLIRVGSGEANAHALEDMICKLLGLPAPATGTEKTTGGSQ